GLALADGARELDPPRLQGLPPRVRARTVRKEDREIADREDAGGGKNGQAALPQGPARLHRRPSGSYRQPRENWNWSAAPVFASARFWRVSSASIASWVSATCRR